MSALKASKSSAASLLGDQARLINRILSQLLAEHTQIGQDLLQVLDYTLRAPGKRTRSALVLWCCELVGGRTNRNAETAAAAA